jgi:hypothetical protein
VGVMVIRLDLETWVIGKGGTKGGGVEKGQKGWGRGMGIAGFCQRVCLGEFLLLLWRVLLSRIAGGWGVYSWYSRLFSGC